MVTCGSGGARQPAHIGAELCADVQVRAGRAIVASSFEDMRRYAIVGRLICFRCIGCLVSIDAHVRRAGSNTDQPRRWLNQLRFLATRALPPIPAHPWWTDASGAPWRKDTPTSVRRVICSAWVLRWLRPIEPLLLSDETTRCLIASR